MTIPDPPTHDADADDLGSEELRDQLRSLLDPTADLGPRTANDVDRALRSRSTTSAVWDLLGTGWWTLRSLATDPTNGARTLTNEAVGADGDEEEHPWS